MSAMLKVYKGVPLPKINRAPKGRRRKYPIETMEVGDAVFEPGRASKSVSAYISRITKSLPDRKFTARNCWMKFENDQPREVPEGTPGAVEGTGVWRIE